MKACKVCGCEKEPSEFHRDKAKKDGLASSCKLCARERASRWYADNTDRGKGTRKDWHIANRAARLAAMAKYAAANPDKLKALRARRDKVKKNASDRAWQAANRGLCRLYHAVSQGRRRAAGTTIVKASVIRELLALQRYRCAVCATSVEEKRHIDHIMPIALGGSHERRNLQILCPSCNVRKNAKHPLVFMRSLGFLL